MVQIKPIALHVASKEYVSQIASLPYDVLNEDQAKRQLEHYPLSFIGLDKPEILTPNANHTQLQTAYELLQARLTEYYHHNPAQYYIYEMTLHGRTQTGLVAGVACDDYELKYVKKHELTREDKDQERRDHLEALQAQTGPIYLIYRHQDAIQSLLAHIKSQIDANIEFFSADGIMQRVFVVPSVYNDTITQLFDDMAYLVIADGHHRSQAYVNARDVIGQGYFMAIMFPEDEVEILGYHRVLNGLCGYTKQELLTILHEKFRMVQVPYPYQPRETGEIGLWIEDSWFKLVLPKSMAHIHDATVVNQLIFDDILSIKNIRQDNRIDFVGGEIDLISLQQFPMSVVLYPTKIDTLFEVAKKDRLLPPKSTWFEPKLYSGIFIYNER